MLLYLGSLFSQKTASTRLLTGLEGTYPHPLPNIHADADADTKDVSQKPRSPK
jgi:hypothetical protein